MNKLGITVNAMLVLILTLFTYKLQAQSSDTLSAVQLLHKADSLIENRVMQEAMPLLEEAASIFEENQAWDRWLKVQHSLGGNYRNMGAFDQGILLVEAAIRKGGEKVGNQHRKIFDLRLLLGTLLYSKGDVDAAIALVNKLLIEMETKFEPNNRLFLHAYSHLSIYYDKSKDYDKALENSLKAFDITINHFAEDKLEVAIAYDRVGSNYVLLKDYETALQYVLKSNSLRRELFQDEYHPRLIITYTNLGICYTELEELDLAETYFLKSFKIEKKTYGEQHPRLAGFLWNLGQFYITKNDYDKALQCFQEELTIRQLHDLGPTTLAENYNRIGRVQLLQGDTKQALISQNKALGAISKEFRGTDGLVNPKLNQILHPNFASRYFFDKLKTLYEHIQTEEDNLEVVQAGINLGHLSLDLWYNISHSLGRQEKSKQEQSSYTRLTIQYACLLAHHGYTLTQDKYYAEQAWQLAETGKSLLLQEAYWLSKPSKPQLSDPKLLLEEQKLQEELSAYQSQLLSAMRKNDSLAINHIQNELIFDCKTKYDRLIEKIAAADPHYFDLAFKPKSISSKELQARLNKDQILVEYLFQRKKRELLIFVLSKDRPLQTYRQSLSVDLEIKVDELNRLLQSFQLIRKDKRTQFIQLSHELYQILLAPVEKQIQDKSQLLIIGEGKINFIPFEVLVSSPEIKDFHELNYLIRNWEISYHYSASLYAKSQAKKKVFNNDLLAFAPVFAAKKTKENSNQTRSIRLDESYRALSPDGQFAPLLFTEEEVRNIVSLFQEKGYSKNKVLLKEEASEAALKLALYDNYRMVHLASHSFSNQKEPALSGIACIQDTETDNGILFSGEIYNMKINSDLLVLSSCESGLGKIQEGEGLLGLNRSFVYAGVPNVVFSLWKVYDKITSQMMKDFYAQILLGDSYSKALQTAKLKLIVNKPTASPHYWSPFLLIGQ